MRTPSKPCSTGTRICRLPDRLPLRVLHPHRIHPGIVHAAHRDPHDDCAAEALKLPRRLNASHNATVLQPRLAITREATKQGGVIGDLGRHDHRSLPV